MGEVVVKSEVDDTLDTTDHGQDKLEVLEEQKEHVDNDQNIPETKINSNFEASLNLESRENVCKPEVVKSNKKPTVTEIIKDNRERDDGYWEVFTVSSPKNKMMFNLWLADNRPSVIRSNEVGWICIELDSDGQSKGIYFTNNFPPPFFKLHFYWLDSKSWCENSTQNLLHFVK